ncbi:MAG: phosphoethanolamine transferase [Idiomarina loihiensis]
MKRITINFSLVLLSVACWLAFAYSSSLLSTLDSYGVNSLTQYKLMAFTICVYIIVLAIARLTNLFKPAAVLLIIIATPASFFMLQYGIVVDADMLINALETDPAEARDQFSTNFFLSLATMGIIPSLLLIFIRIPSATAIKKVKQGLTATLCFSILSVGIAYTSYDEFASLFRNHRDVKYRIVPFNVVSASVSVIKQKLAKPTQFVTLGQDAVQIISHAKPKVMVVILGETARADHFSLNGYSRPTTPTLSEFRKSEGLLSYKEAMSCGTATAVSVPCMFSFYNTDNYSSSARNSSNVLDVLETAGVNATWIENNSGCKNVCDRINTIVLRDKDCDDGTCYDTDMLSHLKDWLANLTHDAVIVLHQLGSHGPAYFERSPEQLKQFLPECTSNELTQCTKDEIVNAYDNSLLMTDRLVSQVIRRLQSHDEIDSSMMYLSDHGESLGDNGIYLHGLPNWLAPKEQRHIPWIVWPAEKFKTAGYNSQNGINHDNFSHTLLGYFDVKTALYDEYLDLTQTNEESAEYAKN